MVLCALNVVFHPIVCTQNRIILQRNQLNLYVKTILLPNRSHINCVRMSAVGVAVGLRAHFGKIPVRVGMQRIMCAFRYYRLTSLCIRQFGGKRPLYI